MDTSKEASDQKVEDRLKAYSMLRNIAPSLVLTSRSEDTLRHVFWSEQKVKSRTN